MQPTVHDARGRRSGFGMCRCHMPYYHYRRQCRAVNVSTAILEGAFVDELDVEGILAFAEHILPRASDLWVQSSLDHKQRLQQLFFPEGIAFDGNRFNRTAATPALFNYLAPSESADERVVSRIFASWNQMAGWLRQVVRLAP